MTGASQIAVGGYGVVAALCVAAALAARRGLRPAGETTAWATAASYFIGLLLLRLVDGEDRLRAWLRGLAGEHDLYAGRGEWQLVFALACTILVGAIVIRAWHRLRQARSARGRTIVALVLLLILSIMLYAVRIISWHATDMLLYAGPLRLNWLFEGAIMLGVAALAGYYLRLSRERPSAVE